MQGDTQPRIYYATSDGPGASGLGPVTGIAAECRTNMKSSKTALTPQTPRGFWAGTTPLILKIVSPDLTDERPDFFSRGLTGVHRNRNDRPANVGLAGRMRKYGRWNDV